MFQGAKVVIIPDNDEAGRKYALYVANLLCGWCSTLKLLTLPAKDVSDYLETHAIGELLQIVDNTKGYVSDLPEWFNDWRGVNQYLWNELLRQRAYKKKPQYKPEFD